MRTYYVRGLGYDRNTKTDQYFEIAFDIELLNGKRFLEAYKKALLDARGLELIKTEYIIKL